MSDAHSSQLQHINDSRAALHRVYTWATDSNASADDLDGAGRVVGNLITWGAKHVEPLFTRLSLALGGGPGQAVRRLLRSLRCTTCAKPYFGPKSTLPARDAPADAVLRFIFAGCVCCYICGATRGFEDVSAFKTAHSCKALTNLIRGHNRTSQYAAILYITTLAALIPDIPRLFAERSAVLALQRIQADFGQRPDGDLDILLAASHRALAVLEDTELHSIAKEILNINTHIRQANSLESLLELCSQRQILYQSLSSLSQTSAQRIITISLLLHAGMTGSAGDFFSVLPYDWADVVSLEHMTDAIYDDISIVKLVFESEDPVLRSMGHGVLLALREYMRGYLLFAIQLRTRRGRTPQKEPRTLRHLESDYWDRWMLAYYMPESADRELYNDEFSDWDSDDVLSVSACSDEDTDSERALGKEDEGNTDLRAGRRERGD